MKKLLLLLIASSSCASLMGMGTEMQVVSASNATNQTLNTVASLHILNSRITPLSSAGRTPRMEDQVPAPRLSCPKISCPPCDCDCMRESCVCTFFPLILIQAALMDIICCPIAPCRPDSCPGYRYGPPTICNTFCPFLKDECEACIAITGHCLGNNCCSCSRCIE